MTRRRPRGGRMIAVLATLAGGAIALVGSTQTWLDATVAGVELPVTGADALPVLQPLSLAVLALALVLTLVGMVLRYVFGVLALVIGGAMAWLSAGILFGTDDTAVSSVVTEHTGVAGDAAVTDLVDAISVTPWAAVTLAASVVVLAAGVLTLVTAHRWQRSGRRYDTARGAHAPETAGPLDPVDSWDDLSRGDDPTAAGSARADAAHATAEADSRRGPDRMAP